MACLTALDAFATDAMLPALSHISADLNLLRDNDRQFIITTIFSGFALGLPVYGILSDSWGRRRPVLMGVAIFLAGTLLCSMADNLTMMIIGRAIQGFGAAGPYVLSVAIVRDTYAEREMAQIMSFIFMIFMAIPAIAPLVGQGVLLVFNWQSIFLLLGLFGITVGLWFAKRQPETLTVERRTAFSLRQTVSSAKEVLGHHQVLKYIFAQGFVFGAFLSYLSTAQQVFQEQYGIGTKFPLYFALLAIVLSIASFYNSQWVIRLGMFRLVVRALTLATLTAFIFLAVELLSSNGLPFWGFMLYMMTTYFFCGMVFGNLSSLAMTPMGHIAGIASATIGCISTLIAFVLAAFIGSFYNGSLLPIIAGFAMLAPLALVLVLAAKGSHLESKSV